LNSKPHEAQLKDQKLKKSLKRSFRRSKTARPTKKARKTANHEKWQRRAKKSLKTS
jgi:hypothetical protein